MRILFLGLALGNLNDPANLYAELILEFDKNGHDIIAVAPCLEDDPKGLHLEKGIKVIRVPTLNLFDIGKYAKGVANLLLPLQYKSALKKSGLDLHFDLILMPTPPITLIDVVTWLKNKYSSKFYLILRDIFPQNAVDLKMMNKKSFIYSYFRKKEELLYRTSDKIGCMSEGNIAYVKRFNPTVSAKKLHLLPNWRTLDPLSPSESTLRLKKQSGFEDKFIIMFGGNIGKPQKLENIIHLAKECSDIKDIIFYIVGWGSEKEKFEKLVKMEKVDNIIIGETFSRTAFFEFLQIADIGLISLSEDFTIPNIPSKALVYFNAKIPILASIDLQTDFGSILEKTQSGLWAEAGNTKELKEKLMLLYENKALRSQMGSNGYSYLKKHLSPSQAYSTIINNIT